MSSLEKAARTELSIVANLETNLEVVLGIRRGYLHSIVDEGSLFLELKYLA